MERLSHYHATTVKQILTSRLEGLRHHVVDKAVGVGDATRLELLLVLVFVDLLEDVLEPPVVDLSTRSGKKKLISEKIYSIT